jgi:4-amino-4-deoxy-L-arabinose transferase-like glycosyltransferase
MMPNSDAHSALRYDIWLWAIVGIALLFRVWGTWYGLPYSYWVDEYHEVLRALELGSGGFNLERVTKGGFYLVLFVEYGVYYFAMKFFGVIDSPGEFAEYFVRDPTSLYLIGRVTAAVAGAATVTAVFYLTSAAYSRRAAVVGALLLALNVLHTDLSRRIGVDVPMALMATMALYFGVKLADSGQRSDYLLAALFAALATTTKLPGILLLLPLLIAHGFFIARSAQSFQKGIASPNMWLAAVVFAVVLIATNPGVILTTGYVSFMYGSPNDVTAQESFDVETELDATGAPNLYLYYLKALKESMGWPLFGLATISLGYAAVRRTAADVMLLAYALANYLAIASTSSDKLYYPRYAIPIVIVMAILSGRTLSDLAARFESIRTPKKAIVMIALLAWPAWQTVVTGYALTRTDTRTLAKEWIESHIPPGSRVLIEGLKIAPVKGTVQLSDTRAGIKRRIEYWKTREPKQAKFLELQLSVHEGHGYDLELVRAHLMEDLDRYVSRGVQYFVVRPEYLLLASKRSGTESARFYADLRANKSLVLIKRFEGSFQTPPGPTIEIFGPKTGPNVAN